MTCTTPSIVRPRSAILVAIMILRSLAGWKTRNHRRPPPTGRNGKTLVGLLAAAVLAGGMLYGAAAQARGEPLEIAHLFRGFQDQERMGPLVLLGLISLAGYVLMALVIFVFMGGGLIMGATIDSATGTVVPPEAMGGLLAGVRDEGQCGSELQPELLPDGGAQQALGRFQRGRGVAHPACGIGLAAVQRTPEIGVEDGRLAAIASEPHIGDGDESESRILDTAPQHLGDDPLDLILKLGDSWICHFPSR